MKVEVREDDGDVLVRDALVMAFFCRRPYPDLAKSFSIVFEEWLARVPDEAKRWGLIGPNAEEYKKVTPQGLARARAELDSGRAATREMCGFELLGPQMINADHEFSVVGSRDLADKETCCLQIRSPSESASEENVESYVRTVHRIATQVPYDSGYASLALTLGVDSQAMAFAEKARRWAFRHPGFDMPSNDATAFAIGNKVRGAFWLNFLGPMALSALGGEAKLRRTLPKEISVEPAGVGVMLRAGRLPEVGDTNRLDTLPMLRALAKVLEPVTLFEDPMIKNLFVDEEARDRWERRHLD